MKLFYAIIILFILSSCSFDDKTGIWKNENLTQTAKDGPLNDFKKISSSKNIFDTIINLDENFIFNLSDIITNDHWKDSFYSESNNFDNFKYNNNNQIILKSKKITKYESNKQLLYYKNNIILNDRRGNIIIYSINKNKVISKFNFYKKRYKKLKKSINLIIENNILFVADNLGYIYAYDLQTNSLLWAKNFKIPFKSNLKVYGDMVIVANIKNNVFFLKKSNGETIKSILTEETRVTNQFVNNFSITKDNLLFLNSFGSLYSINLNTKKIKWFLNLNQSLDLKTDNLFNGNQIVNYNDKIVVSSNNFLYLINSQTGNILRNKNFSSDIKPIINNKYIFLITKNNYLISARLHDGEIIYSYNLKDQLSEYFKAKNKLEIHNFFVANNKLLIFINSKYLAFLNINGQIENIKKLPFKIKSNPIFINGSIIYLDNNNKIKILD